MFLLVFLSSAAAAPGGLRGFDFDSLFDNAQRDFFGDGFFQDFNFPREFDAMIPRGAMPLGGLGEGMMPPGGHAPEAPGFGFAPMGNFFEPMDRGFGNFFEPMGRGHGDRSSSHNNFERVVKSPDGSMQSFSSFSSSSFYSGKAAASQSTIEMQLPLGLQPCGKPVMFVTKAKHKDSQERKMSTSCFQVQVDEAAGEVGVKTYGAGMGERQYDAGDTEASRGNSASEQTFALPFAHIDHQGTKAEYNAQTGVFKLHLAEAKEGEEPEKPEKLEKPEPEPEPEKLSSPAQEPEKPEPEPEKPEKLSSPAPELSPELKEPKHPVMLLGHPRGPLLKNLKLKKLWPKKPEPNPDAHIDVVADQFDRPTSKDGLEVTVV